MGLFRSKKSAAPELSPEQIEARNIEQQARRELMQGTSALREMLLKHVEVPELVIYDYRAMATAKINGVEIGSLWDSDLEVIGDSKGFVKSVTEIQEHSLQISVSSGEIGYFANLQLQHGGEFDQTITAHLAKILSAGSTVLSRLSINVSPKSQLFAEIGGKNSGYGKLTVATAHAGGMAILGSLTSALSEAVDGVETPISLVIPERFLNPAAEPHNAEALRLINL